MTGIVRRRQAATELLHFLHADLPIEADESPDLLERIRARLERLERDWLTQRRLRLILVVGWLGLAVFMIFSAVEDLRSLFGGELSVVWASFQVYCAGRMSNPGTPCCKRRSVCCSWLPWWCCCSDGSGLPAARDLWAIAGIGGGESVRLLLRSVLDNSAGDP